MEENLYDEFGNYIGPEIEDDDDDEEADQDWVGAVDDQEDDEDDAGHLGQAGLEDEEAADRAITLHEDKKYYPEADEVYPEAETLIQEEDTQPITEPMIAPIKTKAFDMLEKEMPTTTFDFNFLAGLMEKPELIRNICFFGSLHSGKTCFVDMLVRETHVKDWKLDRDLRYTDTRKDEQERLISVKASPMSLVVQNTKEKSFLFNIMDSPGHPNFSDEFTAALRLSDGGVLVVDTITGLTVHAEKMIQHALSEKVPFVLVVNGLDRLILELKLPPADAYHKIRHTIEEVNGHVESVCEGLGIPTIVLSPTKGNVVFASARLGFCFSLHSFAVIYADHFGEVIDTKTFAKCLWGDLFFDEESRGFVKEAPDSDTMRSFVQFILEPLYKLHSHPVAEERESLQQTLADVGVFLARKDYNLDSRSLLKRVTRTFFGPCNAFVDMITEHIPSPKENAKAKVEHIYTGDMTGVIADGMKQMDPKGYLMVHTAKNYHRPDCTTFDVFGRVMSGTIFKGDNVKILGEGFSLDDDEDMTVKEVQNLWIYEGRYRVEVSHVPAGCWVLIGGVDASVVKTSTITTFNNREEIEIFHPLSFMTKSVIKVACEPLNPSELPKMVEGLRRVYKSYPLAQTKVEESGEHVVIGTGELYVDSMLHDLRELYGELEIKVADPVVSFAETVVETSSMKCFAQTANEKNKLYMIAEPLEKGLGESIERGDVSAERMTKKELANFFVKKYEWDVLAARSIWAFGPTNQGPNVLVDDTLPTDVDKTLLRQCEPSVVQGFQWATREGPLCDEAIRSCKFKLVGADLAQEAVQRGGGQVIPASRRVCYSAFLLGTPRLMEPVLFTEIECPADCVAAIYTVLSRRRGHVARDLPRPGSPMFAVHAYLPAIESFGFETDLRTHTSGQAMCVQMFDHWSVVPGDPLDKSIMLRPLEPAPAPHLAREFVVKTRRRKGLLEDISFHQVIDEGNILNGGDAFAF